MTDDPKDPVCGMSVTLGENLAASVEGCTFHFCSEYCRQTFLAAPYRYVESSRAAGEGLEERRPCVAYFSMEIALDSRIPTYSGGLGVLAGDFLASCADLGVPVVAVTLLYRKGYFRQMLDESGVQIAAPCDWDPSAFARLLPTLVHVTRESRMVAVQAWRFEIVGRGGHVVPVFLLDTDVEGNDRVDRELTESLYGGDDRYRLAQELVLGIAGVRMLRTLGFSRIKRFHMNEGHASLLTLELLREAREHAGANLDFNRVRDLCVFTTHTPVPAGHDRFSYDLVRDVVGDIIDPDALLMLGGDDRLNMTLLGLNLSRYVNGVAKKHGEVSREMFPGYPIDSITNGVYSFRWTCESFRALFDRYIPDWARDPFSLRHASSIPKDDIWRAHVEAKARLIDDVNRRTHRSLSHEAFTIGCARRATPYKRADLVLADPGRLVEMAQTVGPVQLVFAGKAHPRDEAGKEIIRRLVHLAREIEPHVCIAYLADYDIELAATLTSGVDLWLNTPMPPLEASGTSGMKAAHNGIPSLSVLDGWWIEGHIEGVTGWAITSSRALARDEVDRADAEQLYANLHDTILPTFYMDRERWTSVMRQSIAFNASFFNTHRMVQQYVTNAYF